ncbi:MAG: hypothetical protein JF615_02525, partial [Asticcacaulis sp.]|nr:hypothetical protein [Asticcacaulis sp.]
MTMNLLYRSSAIVVIAAALALGGCRTDTSSLAATDAALPLATGDPQPFISAPPVEQLPAAPAVRYVPVAQPQQAYEYIDDAYAVNDAFDDAPPDYGFDYQGVMPWVWTAANAMRLVEPYDGGERYYYYRTGSDAPYLIRDDSYAYAYSDGRLVSVYDNRGYMLDRIEAG